MIHCQILIIDDDIDDIELLTEAFNESGVSSIHSVTSVQDALEYLEEVYPECIPKLIVTDLHLPMISGVEFLQKMKAIEKYKDVHIVIVSTSSLDSEVDKFKALGALDYIVKPVTYDEYLEVAGNLKGSLDL